MPFQTFDEKIRTTTDQITYAVRGPRAGTKTRLSLRVGGSIADRLKWDINERVNVLWGTGEDTGWLRVEWEDDGRHKICTSSSKAIRSFYIEALVNAPFASMVPHAADEVTEYIIDGQSLSVRLPTWAVAGVPGVAIPTPTAPAIQTTPIVIPSLSVSISPAGIRSLPLRAGELSPVAARCLALLQSVAKFGVADIDNKTISTALDLSAAHYAAPLLAELQRARRIRIERDEAGRYIHLLSAVESQAAE